MAKQKDAYTFLAEKHGFGNSQSYLKVLRFLMTPQQAEMVTYLPGSPEEVAQKTGVELAIVKKNLDELYRKGVIVLKRITRFQTTTCSASMPNACGR